MHSAGVFCVCGAGMIEFGFGVQWCAWQVLGRWGDGSGRCAYSLALASVLRFIWVGSFRSALSVTLHAVAFLFWSLQSSAAFGSPSCRSLHLWVPGTDWLAAQSCLSNHLPHPYTTIIFTLVVRPVGIRRLFQAPSSYPSLSRLIPLSLCGGDLQQQLHHVRSGVYRFMCVCNTQSRNA